MGDTMTIGTIQPLPAVRGLVPACAVSPPARAGKPKLLDQVRDAIRTRHYSYRTEEAYVHWIKRYIFFHGKRHPAEMGKPEIEQFLTMLAVERGVSASTQNQALAALLFLYKEELERDPGWLDDVVREAARAAAHRAHPPGDRRVASRP